MTTFDDRCDRFSSVLSGVSDWDLPSPCAGWTVRDVVTHVIDTQRDFLQRHDLSPGPAPSLHDPAAAWRQHAAAVSESLAGPGVAAREYDGYFGRTTIGETMVDFYGWDLLIHVWDVARATGQAWDVTDDEAERLDEIADGWGAALYSEGVCSAPVAVPADASARDRMLGRLGRDPGWQPPAR